MNLIDFLAGKTMPEARDRLVRPVDIAAVFARRRANPFGVYEDPPETRRHSITFRIHEAESEPRRASLGSPSRASTPTPRRFGTPRGGFGRGRRSSFGGSPLGRENTPVRRGGSVLPAWYPRTPLRDITAIVRVIINSTLLGYFFVLLCLYLDSFYVT